MNKTRHFSKSYEGHQQSVVCYHIITVLLALGIPGSEFLTPNLDKFIQDCTA